MASSGILREVTKTVRAKSTMLRGRSFVSNTQNSPWQSIIDNLNNLLAILQENYVPEILIQKIFVQLFSFINIQLFNSLLLRREFCSFSNGEYVKSGLDELELWCTKSKPELVGSSWDELKHTRQAIGFLVIFQKYRISYDEIVNDLCPVSLLSGLFKSIGCLVFNNCTEFAPSIMMTNTTVRASLQLYYRLSISEPTISSIHSSTGTF
ncbi:myosin-6-like [Zingiber officinale]|uniref:myosin-6-like n=1 Tax=Zingiber officinale TaxID=94328 RepID=UPI001C4C8BE9|nr:myosin-6-like [Zingiber officinale]